MPRLALAVLAALVVAASGRGLRRPRDGAAKRRTDALHDEDLRAAVDRRSPGSCPTARAIVFSSALTGNPSGCSRFDRARWKPARSDRRGRICCRCRRRASWPCSPTRKYIAQRLFQGTLARMSIEGSPRPWMEGVREADWSPDGSTLAIVHDMGSKDRLEYPIGKVLYETDRLHQRSARVAGRHARGIPGSSTAMRRSRLGQGGRCQRESDDAGRRVLGRRGTRLVARRLDAVLCRQRSSRNEGGAAW